MYTTSEKSILKLGAIAAFIMGFLYVLLTFLIAIDPVGMFISSENIDKIIKMPDINILWRSVFSIINVLTIMLAGAATVFYGKKNDKYAGILKFGNTVIVAGMAISSANWIHYIHVVREISDLYKAGRSMEELFKILAFPIDSYFVWSWGSLGIYFLIIGFLGLKNMAVTKKMSVLSLVMGVIPIAMLVLYINHIQIYISGIEMNSIIMIAAVQCGILAPIFCFNFFKYVRRALADKNS